MDSLPVVFLGPSLPRKEAVRLLPEALFERPIRRGDLARLPENATAIGIVDGEFFQSLAVSPKEILPLLERGVPVYGASSMGALRAAELANYGMIGVGKIFELFRMGRLIADDDVALTFCPDTLSPLSEPLVNLRFALIAARRAGLISLAELIGLTRRMRALYFPERSLSRLFVEAGQILGPERSADLCNWWSNAPDSKAEDAKLLLRAIRQIQHGFRSSDPVVTLRHE